MTLKEQIEKILEKTCGFTCPNGAESNKPALDQLLALFKKECEGVIGENQQDEFYGGPEDPPMYDEDAINRNILRAKQLQKLSALIGEEK